MKKNDFNGYFKFRIKYDENLVEKYHKALQEVQRERNKLKEENLQLKQKNLNKGEKKFFTKDELLFEIYKIVSLLLENKNA